MTISGTRTLATIGLAMAIASCAAPKPEVVEKAPPPVPKDTAVAEVQVPEPELPGMPDDEIRIPSTMFNLPNDAEFRASNPSLPKPGAGSGGVIIRSPTEPPSRVKPGEKPAE